ATRLVSSSQHGQNLSSRNNAGAVDLDLGNFTDPAHNVAQLTAEGRQVIIISVVKDRKWVVSATEAGALAYLSKERNLDELADAIRAVHRGETPTSPVHAFLLSDDDRGGPALTPRERQVLLGVAEGMTHAAIARQLGIEKSTVKTHLERIRQKYRDKGRPIVNPGDYVRRVVEDPIRGDLPPAEPGRSGG
ncbi:LuxR C-terminal-related transcriptional regulator, partial [Micromonospora sp. LOL_023]|uniref:LuxR C-terminal-related transcriptional regulator n=1 Tax=Micromonospora sp. LOL_023 TaxID=3345418 RepID=UPI003A88B248